MHLTVDPEPARVTIEGFGGTDAVVLSGGRKGTVIELDGNNVDLQINSITVTQGGEPGSMTHRSGGIVCSGTSSLDLAELHIVDNEGYNSGGVYVNRCTLSATRSIIENNRANGPGGGLNIGDCPLAELKTGVVIADNTAVGAGGGIMLGGAADVTLEGVSFTGNQGDNGGGIALVSSTVVGSDLTFEGNCAVETVGQGAGGGIYVAQESHLTLTGDRTRFTTNIADTDGGGVAVNSPGASASITDARFSGNQANAGGGIYGRGDLSGLIMTSCSFTGNEATLSGGGLHLGIAEGLAQNKLCSTERAPGSPGQGG
ncbi:MAG: putative outer membrane repeat protein [Myxococcota bacterium]